MTTSVALAPYVIQQFLDNTGKPCVGGTLLTQSGGVNYATYSDPLGATPLPNPIPLNSRGEVSTAAGASSELFLQTGVAYTFTLKDSAGNQLWSIGNITTAGGNIAVSFPTASGSANAQIVTNAVPISLGIGTTQWFLPVAANTATATVNVDNTGAKTVLYLTKALVGGELQIGVPVQLIYDGTNWNLAWSAKGPAQDAYVDTGAVNVLTIAANFAQVALVDGFKVRVKANNTTTTAAATLNVGVGGNLAINLMDAATAAPAGAIVALATYEFIYRANSTMWLLQNPSRVSSSFSLTYATGFATTPTVTINYYIEPDGKHIDVACYAGSVLTSNATGFTGTGVPAAIQTTTDHRVYFPIEDAGSFGGATRLSTGASTGTWTFFIGLIASGWTASGNKGVLAGAFTSFTTD